MSEQPKTENTTEIEIDMSTWPRETLEQLIAESCRRDVSINVIIVEQLSAFFKSFEEDDGSKQN